MKKVIVIVGPTAVGKSHIGINIAKRLGTNIISGDSVQVFKGLDIGSAKVTKEEMNGVSHYLIDILDANEDYSVADFQNSARKIMAEEDIPIIVGGTGLYIKSAICDYEFTAPKRDDNFSETYNDLSNEELYQVLLKLDNKQAQKIHPNNRKRVLRAIEVATRGDLLSNHKNKDKYLYDTYIVYLNAPRDLLYERINRRVEEMFDCGLEAEVRSLYDRGIKKDAIGYQEFYPYFLGNITLDEVKEEIKKNTRHLAKKQMTWFKHQFTTHFYDVNFDDINATTEEVYQDILNFLKS